MKNLLHIFPSGQKYGEKTPMSTALNTELEEKVFDTAEKQMLYRLYNSTIYPDRTIFSSRIGDFPNPWNITLLPEHKLDPNTIKTTTSTFTETTDLRAQEIISRVEHDDLPIVINWSGGIDSTVIVSAVVKNFSRDLLDRVIILMDVSSYVENPYFFKNVIVANNLKVNDAFLDFPWGCCYRINGDPADTLWIDSAILDLESAQTGAHKLDPVAKPELLLEYLKGRSDTAIAEWWYQTVLNNARSVNFDLTTYESFFWWTGFNIRFVSQIFKNVNMARFGPGDLSHWRNLYLPWYDSIEYQQWSYTRSKDTMFEESINKYKQQAKDYIFDIDKNSVYRDSKLKGRSIYFKKFSPPVKIYDNGEVDDQW